MKADRVELYTEPFAPQLFEMGGWAAEQSFEGGGGGARREHWLEIGGA